MSYHFSLISAGRATALTLVFTLASASGFAADTFDVQSQIGPNPVLPEPQQYLYPPIHLAPVVGWKDGEKPTVAAGLKIEALATELEHPRSVYALPNGDIFVVESRDPKIDSAKRPKDIVRSWVESYVTSDGKAVKSNRITLLRDTNSDGKPETRSVFLDNLFSPFGVALVGSDLYVANTDAIMRYPYDGGTQITASGTELTPLPGGPIDHHWTKSLLASADGSLLYVGVGSNSNITENGMEAEKNRAAICEVDRATGRWRIFASGLRNPNGLSFEPQTGEIAAAFASLAIAPAMAAAAHGKGETVTPNFRQAIPNIPGKSLVTAVVDYAPGGSSPAHTHPKSAFIFAYVVSGEIESKVNDEPTKVYRAGESWSEAPGAIHSISRNASKTKPAKLLAVFVVDADDKELVTPIK
nr:cupin domain-containing protein [Phyllobacterium sp. IY22]